MPPKKTKYNETFMPKLLNYFNLFIPNIWEHHDDDDDDDVYTYIVVHFQVRWELVSKMSKLLENTCSKHKNLKTSLAYWC
jgi:hypothetical protein